MKTSVKIVACTIILITLLALSCGSPQSNETPVINDDVGADNKLIGVWKFAEWVDTDPDLPETAPERVNEVAPEYYMVFTKKYRFAVGSLTPNRPVLPENPTDSQLLAAWRPVMAMIWTYEVKGNAIITRQLFTKSPYSELVEEHSYPLEFDGDDLLWTYSPDGGRTILTQRYKRIE